jgi:hypothetical protein
MNPNSLLFLYEGETEIEFYNKIFNIYLPARSLRIHKHNLRGIYSINKKVRNCIHEFLVNKNYADCNNITVVVAHDREGPDYIESTLNLELLRSDFIKKRKSRIIQITEIIATQDLESWFFHDLDGIYNYLKTPKSKRSISNYTNTKSLNNKDISFLFHRFNNHYQKGSRVDGFIDHLDIRKIFNNVPELQEFIQLILTLH